MGENTREGRRGEAGGSGGGAKNRPPFFPRERDSGRDRLAAVPRQQLQDHLTEVATHLETALAAPGEHGNPHMEESCAAALDAVYSCLEWSNNCVLLVPVYPSVLMVRGSYDATVLRRRLVGLAATPIREPSQRVAPTNPRVESRGNSHGVSTLQSHESSRKLVSLEDLEEIPHPSEACWSEGGAGDREEDDQ